MKIICSLKLKRIMYVRAMIRKVTVMNELNNFVSVIFGHCGKSKHFALDL